MVGDTIEEIEAIKFAIDPHPISRRGAYFPNKSATSLKLRGRVRERGGFTNVKFLPCSFEDSLQVAHNSIIWLSNLK